MDPAIRPPASGPPASGAGALGAGALGAGALGVRALGARALGAGLVLLAACGEPVTEPPNGDPADPRVRFDLQALGPVPYPPGNPRSEAKIELGQLLFFDPVLSGERDVSCGTCHHPDFGFADGLPRSVGPGGTGLGPDRQEGVSAVTGSAIPEMPRNAPTVLGAALNGRGTGVPAADGFQFWDGRAAGLEDQALRPIAARAEMRGDAYPEEAALDSVVARLRAIPEYVGLFEAAFGDGAGGSGPGPAAIDGDRIAMAIATYQRELVPRASAFDRYVGGEDDALTELELEGLDVFFDRAACTQCHLGPGLSNSRFKVTGVPPDGPGGQVIAGDDAGREEHTGSPEDRYAFRVPGLRNVGLTAPYMHNGAFETLEEVVRFYDSGGHPRHPEVADADLAVEMPRPLDLTEREIDALVAFLHTLTDPGAALPPGLVHVPGEVPSGLPPVSGVAGAD